MDYLCFVLLKLGDWNYMQFGGARGEGLWTLLALFCDGGVLGVWGRR